MRQPETKPTVADKSRPTGDEISNQLSSPQGEPTLFIPLDRENATSVIGYRSNATAGELIDEAELRHGAVLGLLCALSGTSTLNELRSNELAACFQAIRLLCTDAASLYQGARHALIQTR